MPTRIKPNRVGYNVYTCIGIPRPCISPMDGSTNRFECLPKSAIKMISSTPFINLEGVAGGAGGGGKDYDPLNGGINVDLYSRLKAEHPDVIDEGCAYVYACIDPGGFPQDPLSKRQIQCQPGFMDPPATDMDAIGIGPQPPEPTSSESSASITSDLSISDISQGPTSVNVVTELRLTAAAILQWRTRVIYVDNADAEDPWAVVPGWDVTDCDETPP